MQVRRRLEEKKQEKKGGPEEVDHVPEGGWQAHTARTACSVFLLNIEVLGLTWLQPCG